MPTLPEIRIPMPEDEQPLTLYGRITNTNEPPKYDDIMNSNLSKEDKVKQIQYRTKAYQDDLDRQLHKDYARMGLGSLLSGASFHPFFNIPYVGTGIGGAMYDLGQGIVEGDTAGDLAKRAGRGFVIGETIGAVPYVGKAAGKTKAGQAVINSAPVQTVGNVLNKAGEKFANTKLYDALMTDIRAFNPNKQTVYHGSPYDFNKFSNEAIGTGEGAQAHGYGHYTALNKDVAEGYRKRLGASNTETDIEELKDLNKGFKYNLLARGKEDTLNKLNELIEANKNIPDKLQEFKKYKNIVENFNENNLLPSGQLYKLSVPKDDVMLREGATLAEQPKKVQDAIYKLGKYENTYPSVNYNGNTYYDTPGLFKGWKKATNNKIDIYNDPRINDSELIKILDSIQDKGSVTYKGNKFKATNTGQEIYNKLGKDASAQLNNAGIKGISYNGGIDGEARVIFNPEDIEIIRKYYNQPGLFEQLTGKQNTGALVDALLNR